MGEKSSPYEVCSHLSPVKVLFRFWSQFCLCSLTTQMVFGVGKVQMKFLHLLSTEANQSILLRCLNDPPRDPPDSAGSTGAAPHENATLHFHGWNKQMFERDTLLEPQVLQDDCKVTSQAENWRAEFHIRRLNRCGNLFYFILILLLFRLFIPARSYRQLRCQALDLYSSNICNPVPFPSLSDPRWQLARVTFLFPHSGQPSATYCRHTDIPGATAQ